MAKKPLKKIAEEIRTKEYCLSNRGTEFEDWLRNNGYENINGIYTNYNEGIKVRLQPESYPIVASIKGFYTEGYQKLSLAKSKSFDEF